MENEDMKHTPEREQTQRMKNLHVGLGTELWQ